MTALILFLLFTLVPALELWMLIEIGQVIGGWETVAWVVFMGMLGAWLGKRAGFAVLRDIFVTVQEGGSPANQLVEAALVLVGAVLLITPGVMTDLTGALLFIGPVRRWLAPPVKTGILRWLTRRGVALGAMGPGPGHPSRSATEAEASRQRSPERASPGRARFQHPTA